MTTEQRLYKAICEILDLADVKDSISFRAICSILQDHGFVIKQEVVSQRIWALLPKSDESDVSDDRTTEARHE